MEKEIRTHDDCYTEHVRCLQEKPKDQNLSSPADITGGFDAVRKFINDIILLCNNDVSMVKLHNLYKTSVGNVNARVYRSKVKDRIKSEFGNNCFSELSTVQRLRMLSVQKKLTVTPSERARKKS